MPFVFGDDERFRKKATRHGIVALFLFLIALGAGTGGNEIYLMWILGGAVVYFASLAVYYLVLSSKARFPYRKKKETRQDREIREHIRYHLPIIISMMLGGILVVLIILFFVI